MAIPALIDDFRSIAVAIMAIRGQFTQESVGAACGVDLQEIACATPQVRELQGRPVAGPFSIVCLRIPLMDADELPSLMLTPRAGARLYQSDLQCGFTFSRGLIRIDPRIPPEGTVSFVEYRGGLDLTFEFTAKSRVLRKLVVRREF
ncbi:hypothetical protein [Nocardia jejuensis]|uniref:hypothetical protein n=1 Tax=Nocardia jejuensis TaxID=328049 RepID=UPI0008356D8F|nr:hypothetical protein [Nocardia jejuensis]